MKETRKIKSVQISKFWGDKTVRINFKRDINFLIGVNGSGKTTIINLIAAALSGDFFTLDKIPFQNLKIILFEDENQNRNSYIYFEKNRSKADRNDTLTVTIKTPHDNKTKQFFIGKHPDTLYHNVEFLINKDKSPYFYTSKTQKEMAMYLESLVNLVWLPVYRMPLSFNFEDRSVQNSIDHKISKLSSDLVKYFGLMDTNYTKETKKFQKNIFLSLIEKSEKNASGIIERLDIEKDKKSLAHIFNLFQLKEIEYKEKLDDYYKRVSQSIDNINEDKKIDFSELSNILMANKINSIAQEWHNLDMQSKQIYKQKEVFIKIMNKLYQRKRLFLNEKNELKVITQSKKILNLSDLSSGEKQLLIIMGESLLQENKDYIYIADEPELSLHIAWQEKLVDSLKGINSNSQIIFATHSPDIVSHYSDSIINIENCIE